MKNEILKILYIMEADYAIGISKPNLIVEKNLEFGFCSYLRESKNISDQNKLEVLNSLQLPYRHNYLFPIYIETENVYSSLMPRYQMILKAIETLHNGLYPKHYFHNDLDYFKQRSNAYVVWKARKDFEAGVAAPVSRTGYYFQRYNSNNIELFDLPF